MAQPTRLLSLDCLRGLAALSVVLWHWQHLYRIGGEFTDVQAQPGYWILFPFYKGGWIAVEVFFCLSGFVFFWLYSESIKSGNTSAWTFFVLRFSRLYPLHFVMLMVVCVGQILYFHYTKNYFIYGDFDLTDFFQNVLFIQSWKLQYSDTFNGPEWSVSIEILLYAIFFVFCRYVRMRPLAVHVCLMLVGFPVAMITPGIGRGLISFFAGGLVYIVYLRVRNSSALRLTLVISTVVAVSGWLIAIAGLRFGIVQELLFSIVKGLLTATTAHLPAASGDFIVRMILIIPIRLIVIPTSILALVLHESFGTTAYRRFASLGDITYSSYLIHFPMLLFIAVFVVATGSDPRIFQSGPAMTIFFVVLLALSSLSYRQFEMPMQKIVRSMWLRTARPVSDAASQLTEL